MQIKDVIDKKITVRLLVSVAIGGVLGFVLILLGKDIIRRAHDASTMRAEILERRAELGELLELRRDAAIAEEYTSSLARFTPPSIDEVLNFVNDMRVLGKTNRVETNTAFGAETKSTKQSLGSVAFTMSLRGKYSDIVSTIKDIEQSHYPVVWSAVELSEQERGIYRAGLSGVITTK